MTDSHSASDATMLIKKTDLQKFKAKLCLTASGTLIHEGKVLLIKHKKLGFWLNPGGHIDENEFPHKAAEREFFEETGVNVKTLDLVSTGIRNDVFSISEYLPNPILTNLHWVNKESYDKRLASSSSDKRVKTDKWKRGCEQHLNYTYLMEPVDTNKLDFYQNIEETDGIAWFSEKDILELDTIDEIKHEILYCFHLRTK